MIYRLPCLIGKLSNVAEQKHILGREMRVVCWERSMTLRSLLKTMTHSPRKSIVDAFMDKTVSSLIFLLCRRFLHSGFWYFPFFSLWPKYFLLIFFSIHFSHSFTFLHTTFLFQCNHLSHSVLLFLIYFHFFNPTRPMYRVRTPHCFLFLRAELTFRVLPEAPDEISKCWVSRSFNLGSMCTSHRWCWGSSIIIHHRIDPQPFPMNLSRSAIKARVD